MNTRGRPRSTVTIDQTIDAIRRHGQVARAAKELSCSPALLYKRLGEVRLTLNDVLGVPDAKDSPRE